MALMTAIHFDALATLCILPRRSQFDSRSLLLHSGALNQSDQLQLNHSWSFFLRQAAQLGPDTGS